MITTDIEKRKKFIINSLYFLTIFGLIFVIGKFILPFLVPFILGFCIAYILKRPITFLHNKLHFNRTLAAVLCVIVFYIILGGIATALSLLGYYGIESFISGLPALYTNYAKEIVLHISDDIKHFVEILGNNQDMISIINDASSHIISTIGSFISNVSMGAVNGVSSIVKTVPGTLLKTVLMIISSFFIAIDYESINKFVEKQMNPKTIEIFKKIKEYIFGTVLVCIKSYAIIMGITFIELSIGLTILGIKNAFIIAFLTSILDILPVLGTGAVIIPWAIINLILGNTGLALGLLILYITITVIRNIIEPKIVGKELGLHPIVTLISMFIGVNVAGILGLFGFPILISLILYLNREGIIKIFK